MKRNTLRAIVRSILKLLTRVQVIGLDQVPSSGGCLLAVNHMSRLDPPLVFATVDRDDCTALVTDKYQSHRFFAWLVRTVNGIWINREEADLGALRQARDFLRGGGALGIAPEGTRSRTGALIHAKTGTAYLADKAEVPVIPVAIWGTEGATWKAVFLLRPIITIRFGAPLHLPPVSRREREAALQRNTDEIMCRIAAMLPEKYRGVYAQHPRLVELLEEFKISPQRHLSASLRGHDEVHEEY